MEGNRNMVVLVTGASSGMGYQAAAILARRGWKVYAGARRLEKMEPLRKYGVTPLALDVTSDASAQGAVAQVIQAEGHIDALVNNAGYGALGPVECVSLDEARRQLEVNLLGVARMTSLVLPHMRRQHSGRIVNVSSIAGRATMPMAGWYNASKYALEALSDATRMEVRPYGIKVAIIEPGGVRSDWGIIAAGKLRESSAGSVYEDFAANEAAIFECMYSRNLLNLMTGGEKAGKVIAKAVCASRPRVRYTFGLGSGAIRVLHALLPAKWLDAILVTIFSKVKLRT